VLYKFCRVVMNGNDIYVSLAEVAFLDETGVDLSVGGTPSASSVYNPSSHAIAFAFDKNNATQWATAAYDNAGCWLQYEHTSLVDVVSLRVRNSYASHAPSAMEFWGSSDGLSWTKHPLVGAPSWPLPGNTDVVLTIMPPAAPPTFVGLAMPGGIQGAWAARYNGIKRMTALERVRGDLRHHNPTTGTISDRVMVKLTPSSPEVPFAKGRVWLLRLADGYKAWEGWSDAGGYYTATGLELGIEYIAVGIDPYRNQKATGAGPVVATEAP